MEEFMTLPLEEQENENQKKNFESKPLHPLNQHKLAEKNSFSNLLAH